MKIGFLNSKLQKMLCDLLDTAGISFSIENKQTIVPERYVDALIDLADAVRDVRFSEWHNFRPIEPSNYMAYLEYMKSNSIEFEEELINDVGWFLTPSGNNHYKWGIEEIAESNG